MKIFSLIRTAKCYRINTEENIESEVLRTETKFILLLSHVYLWRMILNILQFERNKTYALKKQT